MLLIKKALQYPNPDFSVCVCVCLVDCAYKGLTCVLPCSAHVEDVLPAFFTCVHYSQASCNSVLVSDRYSRPDSASLRLFTAARLPLWGLPSAVMVCSSGDGSAFLSVEEIRLQRHTKDGGKKEDVMREEENKGGERKSKHWGLFRLNLCSD